MDSNSEVVGPVVYINRGNTRLCCFKTCLIKRFTYLNVKQRQGEPLEPSLARLSPRLWQSLQHKRNILLMVIQKYLFNFSFKTRLRLISECEHNYERWLLFINFVLFLILLTNVTCNVFKECMSFKTKINLIKEVNRKGSIL